MTDDYLWDGSGTPDPEVERLERSLRVFRGRRDLESGAWVRTAQAPPRRFRGPLLLAAAVVVACALLGIWAVLHPAREGFEVVRLAGLPRIAASPMSDSGKLPVGAWLETDPSSRARIRIGAIGEADIEPSSRVRLVRAAATDHRLALARGTLHARIWAPPRLFFVDTPSATAVDLGCTYTLTVNDAGAGLVRVTSGWVAFDANGRESFVPEGALCETRPGFGPGTPWFEDASADLKAALLRLDFEREEGGSRAASLDTVLKEARQRDAVTLWHLLVHLEGEERGRVFDRLAALVPPPATVTRDGVMASDRRMIDGWWDELGLGVTTWWRLWKSPGPPVSR